MSLKGLAFFLDILYPFFLVIFSFFGNIIVFIVYSTKYFRYLPSRNIWRIVSLIDIFCVLQILKYLIDSIYGFKIYLLSPLVCKLISYASHLGAVSAWLHAYLAIELFGSIILPNFIKRIHQLQPITITVIITFNMIFYTQRFIYMDLGVENNQTYCMELEVFRPSIEIFLWVDLVNCALLPFFLMFLSSVLLIFTIFKSRTRLISSQSTTIRRKLAREINFSVSLVVINFLFLALYLPIHVLFVVNNPSDLWFSILDNLYYSSYAINFAILIMFNSIFRKQCVKMIISGFGSQNHTRSLFFT